MTPSEVDQIIPEREDNTTRHWVFARYVLGENMMDAFWISHSMRHEPLPLHAMEHIAAHWNDAPEESEGANHD